MPDFNQDPSNDPEPASGGARPVVSSEQVPPQSFKRRNWGKLLLLALIGVPVVGVSVWTAAALNWTYSDADRAGYVQKVSRKGWLCKTWEGTLYTDIARGFRSDSFQFTVRDDSIAHAIEGMIGHKVTLHYEQHKGVPTSCFGETEYFVSGAHEIP